MNAKTKLVIALLVLAGIILVTVSGQNQQEPEAEVTSIRTSVVESFDRQSSLLVRMYGEYQVKEGDTLYSIANNFGLGVTELKFANPQLRNDIIGVGQVISIPTID